MGAHSSSRIIEDVNLAFKTLEILFRKNEAAFEGVVDNNGIIQKVVDEGTSVSWGGAQTKVEVHKRELTNKMFLHSDLLKSLTSSLTPMFFTIRKLALRTNEIKR